MDVVTSLKALNKIVEASQLTSDLGGTFAYCHADWLQLHQVARLRLHRFSEIRKIEEARKNTIVNESPTTRVIC